MKIKVDYKKALLSFGAMIAMTLLTPIPGAAIIAQIVSALGAIGLEEKNNIEILYKTVKKKLKDAFEGIVKLDYNQYDFLLQHCFSAEAITNYMLVDDPINMIAEKMKSVLMDCVDDKKYIPSLDLSNIAKLVVDTIKHEIRNNSQLHDIQKRIYSEQILNQLKDIDDTLQNMLSMLYQPNSAEEYHSPRIYKDNRFHYSSQFVKLYGRNNDIDKLKPFCGYDENMKPLSNQSSFSWWGITGEGGSGKSRLAFDFSKLIEEEGWTVCFPPGNSKDILFRCSENLPNNTLFILDYAEYNTADIIEWLSMFGAQKYCNVLVRVLLIQRVSSNYQDIKINPRQKLFITNNMYDKNFLRLKSLDASELQEIMAEYARNCDKPINTKNLPCLLDKLKKVDGQLLRPLFALMVVDIYIDEGDTVFANTRDDLLNRICEKEYDDIKLSCGDDEDMQHYGLSIILMSTMIGGMELEGEEMSTLLPEEALSINQLLSFKRNQFFKSINLIVSEGHNKYCMPLEPDIIGEFFFFFYLEKLGDPDIYIALAWHKPYYMSRFIKRLYQDYVNNPYLEMYHHFFTYVTIPDSVTCIDGVAFAGCESIVKIIIPNSVTSIGIGAFNGCSNLTEITIPNTITSIDAFVFWGCSSLTEITIPDSVTSIGTWAFTDCCNLTEMIIPDSVTSIGIGAFRWCNSLTKITIPDSVTSIGDGAFEECTNLTEITIPSSVTSIGERTFAACNSLTEIIIPRTIILIKYEAFKECSNLTNIAIPDSVTSIGDGAFEECINLTEITIPSSITSIGEKIFAGCRSLTEVKIPRTVTRIGNATFKECSSLTEIKIPDSVTSIGKGAFEECISLTEIAIPNSVTSIWEKTFSGCKSLIKVQFSSTLTFIGKGAFMDCNSLTEITNPNSVISVGKKAFFRCNNLDITVSNTVKIIGDKAFKGCRSVNIEL
jgi:hypothetical protein